MKHLRNFFIVLLSSLFFAASISYANQTALVGGDLGGGGLAVPKKAFALTPEQMKTLLEAKNLQTQKQIWLNNMTEKDAEALFENVFKHIIRPQVEENL